MNKVVFHGGPDFALAVLFPYFRDQLVRRTMDGERRRLTGSGTTITLRVEYSFRSTTGSAVLDRLVHCLHSCQYGGRLS